MKRVSVVSDTHQRYLRDGAEVWEVEGIPGFRVVPGALTEEQQAYWVQQCFREYMRPPNKNNLDLLYDGLPSEGLYNAAGEHILLVERETNEEVLLPRLDLLRRMRWTTLGYQYNWTTKEYDFDLDPAPFPTDLADFSRFTAEACGYGPDFRSEAGIVNWYGLGDTLTSHVDRSELTMEAPLLSVSLGSSCVFLVGGTGREDPVTPVVLRSGDLSILSGPARHFFHGVPRVLPGTLPRHLDSIAAIRDARLNLNIRQVT
jgi:alkylated DNA repair protein alkB family protein 1